MTATMYLLFTALLLPYRTGVLSGEHLIILGRIPMMVASVVVHRHRWPDGFRTHRAGSRLTIFGRRPTIRSPPAGAKPYGGECDREQQVHYEKDFGEVTCLTGGHAPHIVGGHDTETHQVRQDNGVTDRHRLGPTGHPVQHRDTDHRSTEKPKQREQFR